MNMVTIIVVHGLIFTEGSPHPALSSRAGVFDTCLEMVINGPFSSPVPCPRRRTFQDGFSVESDRFSLW